MELLAAYAVGAVALTLPFALWVYVRRARWREPGRAVAYGFVIALGLILALSALGGWFYPFGFPGRSERDWRAAAVECQARYAAARSAADSAAVDSYQYQSGDEQPPVCHALRVAGLLSPDRQCRPGSRCARIRRGLGLPDP